MPIIFYMLGFENYCTIKMKTIEWWWLVRGSRVVRKVGQFNVGHALQLRSLSGPHQRVIFYASLIQLYIRICSHNLTLIEILNWTNMIMNIYHCTHDMSGRLEFSRLAVPVKSLLYFFTLREIFTQDKFRKSPQTHFLTLFFIIFHLITYNLFYLYCVVFSYWLL